MFLCSSNIVSVEHQLNFIPLHCCKPVSQITFLCWPADVIAENTSTGKKTFFRWIFIRNIIKHKKGLTIQPTLYSYTLNKLVNLHCLSIFIQCNGGYLLGGWCFKVVATFPLNRFVNTQPLALATVVFIIKCTPCITSKKFNIPCLLLNNGNLSTRHCHYICHFGDVGGSQSLTPALVNTIAYQTHFGCRAVEILMLFITSIPNYPVTCSSGNVGAPFTSIVLPSPPVEP